MFGLLLMQHAGEQEVVTARDARAGGSTMSRVSQLNVYPGLKGLKELLGHVPSWVSYEEKERVEVRTVATS